MTQITPGAGELRTKIIDKLMPRSKAIASKYGCDLTIPNFDGAGFGNIVVYTRLVEELAFSLGHPLTVITGKMCPIGGMVETEDPFAFWRHNPFIQKILDIETLPNANLTEFYKINNERKYLVQINHVIENLCFAFGVRARALRPSLFLTCDEMKKALDTLKNIPRPLICIHPGGKSSSQPGSPWHQRKWKELIKSIPKKIGQFQIGRLELDNKNLNLPWFKTNYREMMALIWASDVFIGFNSGPAQIATAFEKPSIVLFDIENIYEREIAKSRYHVPSIMLRWAYPQNHNFAIMPNDKGNALLVRICDTLNRLLTGLCNH